MINSKMIALKISFDKSCKIKTRICQLIFHLQINLVMKFLQNLNNSKVSQFFKVILKDSLGNFSDLQKVNFKWL